MVEQRPFKALAVGSSPTQPNFYFSALIPQATLIKPLDGRSMLVNNDTAIPLFG
jgi:hypothetical protein